MRAVGSFEVQLAPLPVRENAPDKFGRLSIDKQFNGDLEATSRGEMLSSGTDVAASAGYVAIERVTGTLAGRTGEFVLQHFGTMARGDGQLRVVVVPDSGTGELVGLSGTMEIDVSGGGHAYVFEYAFG